MTESERGELIMSKATNILIVVILVAAVYGVIIYKHNKQAGSLSSEANSVAHNVPQPTKMSDQEGTKTLPRLVDLGAGTCIPCKMMAPILEELKKEYAGVFNVNFIDIHKNPDQADKYSIRVIPTQIFFDASGKELFRHEGFFSKEDILAKWAEIGVELSKLK